MDGTEHNLDVAFLAGGGELGQLMRDHDWRQTPLGEPTNWPRSLKTVVRIMLTSSQPIWIGWGPSLIYLYNDPYRSIIGGKHPWSLGRPVGDVWREIWGDIEPLLKSAMSGDGTFVESQLLIMERNGYPEETYYTFSYSPIPGDDGEPAGIICANSDETRRVIGERQLVLLRHLAADAADAKTVDEAVASCMNAIQTDERDLLFTLVFLRQAGEAHFRLAGHTGSGDAQWHKAIQSLDPLEAPWHAETALRSGQAQIIELNQTGITWPTGNWKVPAQKALALPLSSSGDSKQEGLLVVGLNPYRLLDARYQDFLTLVAQQLSSAVSNAHAYQAEKHRAEELARLDLAKTQFFSNVSHEFRTPLTLMQGPLADAMADEALPATARSHLEMVERNVTRLTKLVNSLLEFSRIEAGRHESVFRPTDLSSFTQDLASTFRSAMERAGLDFDVHCQPLSQTAYVDRDQWERIVLNLLSNALKFTMKGQVKLHVFEDRGQAVLEVSDTGVGVPEDEVPRLFERFHRVHGSQSRTHEGSGIGLALVQELVRLHGGSVQVHSQLNKGTTFTVHIPLGSAHLPKERIARHSAHSDEPALPQSNAYVQEALRWLPDGMPSSDALATPDAHSMNAQVVERYKSTWGARIVVADDNADMRQYLTSLLQPYYEVETASHGEEALAAALRKRPALLLSDVMMPKLDGFGLLAAVRSDKRLRTLPVILLSARAGEEATVEGLERGADDYLVKPFTARELLARVAAIIELDRVRRATEEQLRVFLSGAKMFTWDLDLRTGEISFSQNAEDVIGAPPRHFSQGIASVHPEDQARHQSAIEAAAKSCGELWDEVRIMRSDNGDMRWLEIRAHTVCDESGEAVKLSGLSFDITERKRLEEMLRDGDRRKDEFLAMLAHELRNPMAAIRNAAVLMLRVGADDKRVQKAAEITNRQVAQLTRMVDDLLDVSRITRGRVELEEKLVELSSVLTAAIEVVEPTVRDRRHTLTVSLGLPLFVVGDAARLQQCVVNLLMNSAKYTDPGGQIRVELFRKGETAVIQVIDSGVGIAPEILPTVFDLFVQSERTLDRSHGGLGIGLSIVKRLIEMHGGQIRASSPGIGKGATFEISLPLTEPATVQEQARSAAPVDHRRVVIVDDNRDAAETLCQVLELDGHEVRTVFTAEDALQLIPEVRPDVVFLDIGLPNISGYQVATRLRAIPALAATRLVALTGYGQPMDKQNALKHGFDGHLVKPASMEDVIAALSA